MAAGYGPDVPLYIPENGFIGINVPLTGARKGSLSTRTTHPHFIEQLSSCVRRLGIANPIVNPFRLMTKGEILATCQDQQTLRRLAGATLSCAHPEAARWVQEEQTNCGYCFPCLIRRASMHHVGLDRASRYTYDVLADNPDLAARQGQRPACHGSLAQPAGEANRRAPQRAGTPADVAAFADVYLRGRREILDVDESIRDVRTLRRQLPA